MAESLTVQVCPGDAAVPLAGRGRPLTEAEFTHFYERTARMLRAFIRHSGAAAEVDDLLQESYLRFARTGLANVPFGQQKAYLYKIASSVLTDRWRQQKRSPVTREELPLAAAPEGPYSGQRIDFERAFAGLNQKEQAMLWLAYAEGAAHREIAEQLGFRVSSMKGLLFRARQKLLGLIQDPGSER